MMGKVLLTLDDLGHLAKIAAESDAMPQFAAVAMQWATEAHSSVVKMRALLLEAMQALNACTTEEGPDHPELISARYTLEHIRHYLRDADTPIFQPKRMVDAPRDGTPILAWCDHAADPYMQPDGKLTLYAAHSEGMSHAGTGFYIVQWGGAWDDRTWEQPDAPSLPDWWFVNDTDFEMAANPVEWYSLPERLQSVAKPEGTG